MIARRTSIVLANSGIGALLGYIALLAMARWMGDELVGARAYALGIVFLLGIVTRLGFPTTHARRLAAGEELATNTGTYMAIKVALTAAFVAVALVAAGVWFALLDKPVTDVTEGALWTGILIVVARSLRDVAVNTFRGLERIFTREAVLLVNTVVTVAGTVAAATAYAWSHGRWSPAPGVSQWIAGVFDVTGPMSFAEGLTWLMGAYLLGDLVSLSLAWALFLIQGIPMGRPDRAIAWAYTEATFPIMLISISAVVLRRMDEVMLGFWQSSADVGHYSAAARLSALMLLAGTAVRIVLMPAISRMQAAGRMDQVQDALAGAERWLGILAWPVLLFGITATAPILHIMLSDAFLPAAWVLAILLVHSLLATFTAPLRAKALGLGHQGTAARIAFQAILINLALNTVLIPDSLAGIPLAGLSADGAAIATLASGIWFTIAYRRLAHDSAGHPYFGTELRRQTLVAAVLIVPLWWIGSLGITRFYHLAGYGLFVLALWLAALALTGGLGRDDIRRLRGWLTPSASSEAQVRAP